MVQPRTTPNAMKNSRKYEQKELSGKYRQRGELAAVPKQDDEQELMRVPCEWVCPKCGQMETDELSKDEHECHDLG